MPFVRQQRALAVASFYSATLAWNVSAVDRAAARFSGHSLRVGFATSAAEAGSGPDEIATVTRHASLEMPRWYAERADALGRSLFNLDGMTV